MMLRTFQNIHAVLLFSLIVLFTSTMPQIGWAQDRPNLTFKEEQTRDDLLKMLGQMQVILRDNYYDTNFRGIDLNTRITIAKERIKTLKYNWQMYRVLVQLLMDFNDSHTRFIMPPRKDHFTYGISFQMIGNDCFVTSVTRGSDAQKQGVEIGDQVLIFGKFVPNRPDMWKIKYVLYKLDPADTLDLRIRKPDQTEKALTIKARTMSDREFRAERLAREELVRTEPFKCRQLSAKLVACKLYTFLIEKDSVDKMMKLVSKYPNLILDLRGNLGGYVATAEYMTSHFFKSEVKINDEISRKKTVARVTKSLGDRFYTGAVAILQDSESASAAELFSRVLQIEKRGNIYGDISSGRVMTSIVMPFRLVDDPFTLGGHVNVGMSVTVADIVMSDGSRLEGRGVIPDELLLPTALALANKTDPLLAYVADKFGVSLTAANAGEIYFNDRRVEIDDDDER